MADPSNLLVDIRSDAERRDDVGGTIGLGVIPGAVRLDWTTLVDADGRLLPPDAIQTAAQTVGLSPGRKIVLLGLYGTDTGLPWLALRLAGYASVAIYDGGWNQWARDPNTAKTSLS
jgi:3-mercaptopyruvate sulfurtransferase SseA